MKTRNEVFTADGRIDCEINHPVYGWIPFTASPDDPEKSGRDLFAELQSTAAAHVPHNPTEQEIAAALAEKKTRDLTPARFAWMLAFTGLGDVWDALEGALKSTDRARFALVKSQRAKTTFNQAATLALVAQFRPVAAKLAPDVDLSDQAIISAWAQAAAAEI